jgi:hypothetical protein
MPGIVLPAVVLVPRSGCTPTSHRNRAYRFDEADGRALERRAGADWGWGCGHESPPSYDWPKD